MNKITVFLISLLTANLSLAQPDITDLLKLNESLVQVSVKLENGNVGSGTGVVVSKEYVATNCHVLANAKGATITKHGDSFKPIAMKADWKHDLCLLKFDDLTFKPLPMRDSPSLVYEEEVFTLGYPIGNNVPQPSFGNIKAIYPFDASLIIRSSAAFALGSSGGALFDQKFNLIGITSFKSPGHQGFFYSLPVEWIKRLFESADLASLNTNEIPFWALPLENKPYFMQVVIPYQNHDWNSLQKIATQWITTEPNSSDGWYFLGIAENELKLNSESKLHLNRSTSLNPRNLDALLLLSKIALSEHDLISLVPIKASIELIDENEASQLSEKIALIKLVD